MSCPKSEPSLEARCLAALTELVRSVVRDELAAERAARDVDQVDHLLDVAAAARLVSVKPATVRAWIKSGKLKTAGKAGKSWRLRREEVIAAVNLKGRTSTTKTETSKTPEQRAIEFVRSMNPQHAS